ncbi:hypothetical protein SERLA73DRAFT_171486 [Serpula lacrymans var. lacrymans S7.3]|uniref:Uncharacterized protein n=2 Tax=Serpula lacrymans var. lacrymans TaxID=341189 RepID=F8QBC2_SERL3|nr:uncharacterized protein SERLADRAFT_453296 [Serpula lacrymans var. lacrymans S7.9]EGN94508.1 hypothetical protein SERLA73DRAFT_171486 [Serpula lacrymans var. lacrymans S7.3]EGO19984.1 hypothetical protein SERLADRAFT_453296 [Serpula lacrymans var. lacrymans S7.9]
MHTAKRVHKWARLFITDREDLPMNLYGSWNVSLLDTGELAKELHANLQTIGKYVSAQDIVRFLDREDIKSQYGLKKSISLATTRRWMHMMDFRWTKAPLGQYTDGHGREDVVTYRQTCFLPTIAELEWNMRSWKDDIEEARDWRDPAAKRVVVWWHNESTFYANDRRKVYWVHLTEKAVPCQKGEGVSIMVADFISVDYSWMTSPDSKQCTRILFKASKNHQGYFSNEDILSHACQAMDLLENWYSTETHVLVFDNAPTHLKRADDALSARKMSKYPTKRGRPFFGVQRNVVDESGQPVYRTNGKVMKEIVRMADARLADGSPQSLYFPPGDPQEGAFRGMVDLLEERGYKDIDGICAKCPGFKCPKDTPHCCLRRMLYNEPDFAEVESLLEVTCRARGFQVIFLPKFHCKLNFIEQCWGHAKRTYCQFPPSNYEADLEHNVIAALDAVPLCTMRQFATRSLRFMDAYRKGLDGKQAMWANRRY